jgi:hypothetical protein
MRSALAAAKTIEDPSLSFTLSIEHWCSGECFTADSAIEPDAFRFRKYTSCKRDLPWGLAKMLPFDDEVLSEHPGDYEVVFPGELCPQLASYSATVI